jgi:hypothetical protein
MTTGDTLEVYETLLEKYKDRIFFSGSDAGLLSQDGKYIAHVRASLLAEADGGHPSAQTSAVVAHTNPTVALLLAKVIALSELVGEPTFPFYAATMALKAAAAPVAQPTGTTAAPAQPAAPSPPADYSSRPIVDPDGKVRCWAYDEKKGGECGTVVDDWDGKSAAFWGEQRKKKYGKVLCPKHIAMAKRGN